MKFPLRKALSILLLLAFVACAEYLTLNGRLLGGHSYTRVSSDFDISEGWQTSDGTPVSLDKLNDIEGFSEHGVRISRVLEEEIEEGVELNYLSKNATTHLYYDDVEVYSHDPDPAQYGLPYGAHFNFAPLAPVDHGKVATLEIRPVYADSASQLLDVRISGTTAYIQRYAREHSPAFILSMFVLFLGIGVISLQVALRNVDHGDLDLYALGSLSILLGLWSGAETLVPQLVTGLAPLITAIDYLALLFTPLPIVRFTGSLVRPPHRGRFEAVAMVANVLAIGSTMVLAVGFGYDMHRLLPISHAQLVLSAVLMVTEVVLSRHAHGRSLLRGTMTRNRLILIAFLIFIGCAILDFVRFSVSAHAVVDSARFMRVGLFCFSLILAFEAFRASISYMQRANRAEAIEQVAYIDALTGIGNRTAWHNMHEELKKALDSGKLDDVMVCQFDVNFLKKVNDTYGHAAGDEYIQRAASTINRSFGTEGSCYRTGGDEFTAVIAGIMLPERLEFCQGLLDTSVEEQKQSREGMPISMAAGYARVSETSERTLDAAQKLADERMYANKRAMKGERTD